MSFSDLKNTSSSRNLKLAAPQHGKGALRPSRVNYILSRNKGPDLCGRLSGICATGLSFFVPRFYCSSLEAHGWGLAWFEQKRSAAGEITFERHIFMDNYDTKNAGDVLFTEPHGSAFADIDGDGIKDFIVGKRFMSHFGYNDPDPYGPAVLYWYRVVRNKQAPGGAEFVPELIHNRSGVGSHVTAMDINKDGAVDIATSSSLGTYIFWGTKDK